MSNKQLFRQLDPPPGGFERLQARLHRRSYRGHWLPAAAAACLIGLGLFWHAQHQAERDGFAELRQTLESARQPPVLIDDREPERLAVASDLAVVYWLNAPE